jgi:hypothetical protein
MNPRDLFIVSFFLTLPLVFFSFFGYLSTYFFTRGTETSTPGIAFTIPETETAALETKTMQERTTTDHNLLSKVEKLFQ